MMKIKEYKENQEDTAAKNKTGPIYLAKQGAAAAFSACVAEFLTIPMDTVKVRLQMQQTSATKVEPETILTKEMKE